MDFHEKRCVCSSWEHLLGAKEGLVLFSHPCTALEVQSAAPKGIWGAEGWQRVLPRGQVWDMRAPYGWKGLAWRIIWAERRGKLLQSPRPQNPSSVTPGRCAGMIAGDSQHRFGAPGAVSRSLCCRVRAVVGSYASW